jgi:hypothetical protein
VTGRWRKVYSEELHNLYSSSVLCNQGECDECNTERSRDRREMHAEMWTEKPKGNRRFGRHRRRREYILKLILKNVRFQVLMAASMKFRVFWDVAPCSHVEVERRFRVAYRSTLVHFNVTTRRYITEYS